MARVSREVREARAILTAQHQLDRRLGTIAFEEEVLYPALERVKDGTLDVTYTPAEGISLKEKPALESGA